MIVVAIIAIIAAAIVPFYQRYSIRTFRSETFTDLLMCSQGMERNNSITFTYANALDTDNNGTGDATTGAVTPNICTPLTQNYAITVTAADATGFTIRATPNAGTLVAGDGLLEVDAAGVRRWDRNNDGDFLDTDETSWSL